MGAARFKLCPCCKKDIRAGIKDVRFYKHLIGCQGSFGKEKGVKHFKKLPVMK